MPQRQLSLVSISFFAFLNCVLAPCWSDRLFGADSRPNIVLIVADDLGINDLACYGRKDHETPHLDRLAKDGIRFTNAYCGLSICSASRLALMTGKTPARLHLTNYLPGRPDAASQLLLNARIVDSMPPEERTIAEELRKVGYRTGLFGKWHLGAGESSAKSQGFDVVYEPSGEGKIDLQEGRKNEFAITRQAIEFIETSKDQPYFCYIPHHSPHIPLNATEQEIARFQGSFSPRYAASVASLDLAVGQLVSAVESQVTDRETWILFTSDNGGLHVPEVHDEPMTHNSPFRAGKGYLYEGGLRVPMLIKTTKGTIKPNQLVDSSVSLLDLFPTFLTIAGVNVSNTVGPLDGNSLVPQLVDNKEWDGQRTMYWHFPNYTNQGGRPASAIRRGKWKLIYQWEDETIELFDLESDQPESRNLVKENSTVAQELNKELQRWLVSVGAQIPKRNADANSELHRGLYVDTDPSKIDAVDGALSIAKEWKDWRKKMNEVVRGKSPVLEAHAAVILPASESTTHGKNIRYEPEPQKNVVGYWTEVDDWCHWEFEIAKEGEYVVEVQYGCGKGNGGSTIQLLCDESAMEWQVVETGHFQSMILEEVGKVRLKPGSHRIEVRPKRKSNFAIMDIRKITLRPNGSID